MEISTWKKENGILKKSFSAENYREHLAIVNRIGQLAIEENHHPEIILRYDGVEVSITTHDAGNTITEKDIKLAKRIDDILT
ncbi:MAG: 4a-hydroxytetrahydrobiopterin dehydratase [Cryomorphaceae bacterium]|nr:4a-hydroxytetrahydrobiopterin dehydratase [Cryomorphaceae bacterium]